MTTVRKKAYVIPDGTTLPIDRAGCLIRASDALPGATHDLTAARTHGIPATLAAEDIKCWTDKAYQGGGPAIHVPIRGKHLRGWRRRDHARMAALQARADKAQMRAGRMPAHRISGRSGRHAN
ncbi:hypothetical protein [Streptomyces clavifer]|uniref:hypothetical protein n=1 Tax=Streptomyces clavifer TaxID=68188 RepID=UPI003F4D2365